MANNQAVENRIHRSCNKDRAFVDLHDSSSIGYYVTKHPRLSSDNLKLNLNVIHTRPNVQYSYLSGETNNNNRFAATADMQLL